MFNFINARVLKRDELNPFADPWDNPFFWVIVALTFVLEYLFVQYIGRPVRCSPLTFEQHFHSVLLGSLALVFGFIEKKIPERFLPIPMLFKESEEVADGSRSKTKSLIDKTRRSLADRNLSGVYKK
jgi:hypothetical protein